MRAAASRTFWTAGSSRPMRIAMMAMTTSSSISVNARRGRAGEIGPFDASQDGAGKEKANPGRRDEKALDRRATQANGVERRRLLRTLIVAGWDVKEKIAVSRNEKRRGHSTLCVHDTGRPSRYGMTPWNCRPSRPNTSGKKCRSPSHSGSCNTRSISTHSRSPSGFSVRPHRSSGPRGRRNRTSPRPACRNRAS